MISVAYNKLLDRKLLNAVETGNAEKAEALLKEGANPNAVTLDNERPVVMLAADRGDLDLVLLLVRHGADIRLRDDSNTAVMHMAASKNHAHLVAPLCALGAYVNPREVMGASAFYNTSWQGHYHTFTKMLDRGAFDADYASGMYADVLRFFQSRSAVDQLVLLHEYIVLADHITKHGASRDWLLKPDGNGRRPIDSAGVWRHFDKVRQQLTERGEVLSKADLFQPALREHSAFQRAVECGKLSDVLEMLEAQGESLTLRDIKPQDRELDTSSKILQTLIDEWAVAELISHSSLQGAPREQLALLKLLPTEDLYQQLPHARQYCVRLSQQIVTECKGRS